MADFHDHPETDDRGDEPARSTWNTRERIPPGALQGGAERTRLDAEAMLAQLDTLQSQLNRAGSEAERMQRLAMLGELSGFLAHEFNNILTPLLAHSQLALREPRDPERMAQVLARVVSGVKRASAIAESILGLASQAPEQDCGNSVGGNTSRGNASTDPFVPRGTRESGASSASTCRTKSGGDVASEPSSSLPIEPISPPCTSIRASLKEALRHFSHIIDNASLPSGRPGDPPRLPAQTKLGRGEPQENEVQVVIEATPGLAAAIAPIELEQVLMNLALNAKRAMEQRPPSEIGTPSNASSPTPHSPRTITIRTGTAHPGTTHGGERVPRGTQICSDSVCIDTVQRTDQSKLNPIYIRTDRARVVIEIEDNGGGFDASTLVRLGLSGFVIIEPTSPSQRDLSADGHDGSSGGALPNQTSSQHPGRTKRGGKSKEIVGASRPEPAHATSGGSGLGLEICRRIVTRAGGWIEIESAPGIGSIVRVVLPASQARGTGHAAPPGDANADSPNSRGSSHAA